MFFFSLLVFLTKPKKEPMYAHILRSFLSLHIVAACAALHAPDPVALVLDEREERKTSAANQMRQVENAGRSATANFAKFTVKEKEKERRKKTHEEKKKKSAEHLSQVKVRRRRRSRRTDSWLLLFFEWLSLVVHRSSLAGIDQQKDEL